MGQVRICLLIALLLLPVSAAERVCGAYDGDTVTLCDGRKVRLYGVDCPERKQPYGLAARDYTLKLTAGRDVSLDCVGKSYKRQVCRVAVAGLDLGRELVGWGLAYREPRYDKAGEYAGAEAFAQRERRGVWSGAEQVRPWEWRHSR